MQGGACFWVISIAPGIGAQAWRRLGFGVLGWSGKLALLFDKRARIKAVYGFGKITLLFITSHRYLNLLAVTSIDVI